MEQKMQKYNEIITDCSLLITRSTFLQNQLCSLTKIDLMVCTKGRDINLMQM